jgi:hypothetical protein
MKAKLSATEFTFGGRTPQLRNPIRALHVRRAMGTWQAGYRLR